MRHVPALNDGLGHFIHGLSIRFRSWLRRTEIDPLIESGAGSATGRMEKIEKEREERRFTDGRKVVVGPAVIAADVVTKLSFGPFVSDWGQAAAQRISRTKECWPSNGLGEL